MDFSNASNLEWFGVVLYGFSTIFCMVVLVLSVKIVWDKYHNKENGALRLMAWEDVFTVSIITFWSALFFVSVFTQLFVPPRLNAADPGLLQWVVGLSPVIFIVGRTIFRNREKAYIVSTIHEE
jgi:hypothetical protein